MDEEKELILHLFRQEFSRIVAVIARNFGLDQLALAEDIAAESFLMAAEQWRTRGIPANPAAWLHLVARQKMLQHLRREKIFERKVKPKIKPDPESGDAMDHTDFSLGNIKDSQLRMMFAVCDPAIASEAQIALALRVLCGFGIDEIAQAFLTSKETINKRLFRAKERLKAERVTLEMPPDNAIPSRLDNVLHIIYLLFNEGYYSTAQGQPIRKDLCHEAIHLGQLLTEHSSTDLPKTNALLALMCFNASRLSARYGADELMILYDQQDRTRWDHELIGKGKYFLEKAASGEEISSYHLEAGIAFWNAAEEETNEKWEQILHHYDLLMEINYSPVVALNRAYALYRARGREQALPVTEALQLTGTHFYFVLLGELYRETDKEKATRYFENALALAKSEAEKKDIFDKLRSVQT